MVKLVLEYLLRSHDLSILSLGSDTMKVVEFQRHKGQYFSIVCVSLLLLEKVVSYYRSVLIMSNGQYQYLCS